LAQDLNGDYIETCATYGMNIDRVFSDAALKILRQKCHIPNSNSVQLGGLNARPHKTSTTPLRNQAQRNQVRMPFLSRVDTLVIKVTPDDFFE